MDQARTHSLWIDGVGGYLLYLQSEVLVGQASSDAPADIQVVGDLARRALVIRRIATDYLLQPIQPVRVGEHFVDRPTVLASNTHIEVGNRIRFKFEQPSALSATARLQLTSVHKFRPHVDGILLMADTCLLGPGPQCHVVCRGWGNEILLFRGEKGLCFRFHEPVCVEGAEVRGTVPVKGKMRVEGDSFSFTFQPSALVAPA